MDRDQVNKKFIINTTIVNRSRNKYIVGSCSGRFVFTRGGWIYNVHIPSRIAGCMLRQVRFRSGNTLGSVLCVLRVARWRLSILRVYGGCNKMASRASRSCPARRSRHDAAMTPDQDRAPATRPESGTRAAVSRTKNTPRALEYSHCAASTHSTGAVRNQRYTLLSGDRVTFK